MKTICIKGGRIIDPSLNRDEIGNLYFNGDKIIDESDASNIEYFDAKGLLIFPGLIDLRCHINDLSGGNCENISSVTRAAGAGGYSTVVLMPDLNPIPDNPATIQFTRDQINKDAIVNIKLCGNLTKGSKGKELAPIGSLQNAGVVAISDSPVSTQNNQIFCKAVEYASMFEIPVIDIPRDLTLSENGNAHDGPQALKMGLGGFPRIAEELHVQRAISISRSLKSNVHLSSISSIGSVEMIRDAKKKGVSVTADVTPHHISLTENNISGFNTNFKTSPPLREEIDRLHLVKALMDGTIDCVSTAHQPITEHLKNVEYDLAPSGVIGLETSLNISLNILKQTKGFTWLKLIKIMSTRAAEILNISGGTLKKGSHANIVLFDPLKKWKYTTKNGNSNGKNSPFDNMLFEGKVVETIINGEPILNYKKFISL